MINGAVLISDPRKRRKCPLCSQNMYLYNMNLQEMVIMCENIDCGYPFGYEALQIVTDESQLVENPVRCTPEFWEYPTPATVGLPSPSRSYQTGSVFSSTVSSLSECDGPSQLSDGDNLSLSKNETYLAKLTRRELRRKRREQKNKELQKLMDSSEELMSKLVKLDKVDPHPIMENMKITVGASDQGVTISVNIPSLEKA